MVKAVTPVALTSNRIPSVVNRYHEVPASTAMKAPPNSNVAAAERRGVRTRIRSEISTVSPTSVSLRVLGRDN